MTRRPPRSTLFPYTTHYQSVLRFGDSTDPEIQTPVARALVNKGIALERLDRTEKAVTPLDQSARRFGDSTDPVIQTQVAWAILSKAIALGDIDTAVTDYHQL